MRQQIFPGSVFLLKRHIFSDVLLLKNHVCSSAGYVSDEVLKLIELRQFFEKFKGQSALGLGKER